MTLAVTTPDNSQSLLHSLPPLDSTISSVSPQFVAPPSSLPPHSVAPKVPWSSPSASYAARSSSCSAGPHVFIGSQPATSSTLDYSPDDVLQYVEDDVRSSYDSDSLLFDKVAFSKHFQDMINLVTGYFPSAKPSLPAHSMA